MAGTGGPGSWLRERWLTAGGRLEVRTMHSAKCPVAPVLCPIHASRGKQCRSPWDQVPPPHAASPLWVQHMAPHCTPVLPMASQVGVDRPLPIPLPLLSLGDAPYSSFVSTHLGHSPDSPPKSQKDKMHSAFIPIKLSLPSFNQWLNMTSYMKLFYTLITKGPTVPTGSAAQCCGYAPTFCQMMHTPLSQTHTSHLLRKVATPLQISERTCTN